MSFDGSIHSVLLDFQRNSSHRRSDESQNGTDSFLFLKTVQLWSLDSASELIAAKDAN